MSEVPPDMKLLPWWQESAFKAWVKGTLTDFSAAAGAMIGILTENPSSDKWWWGFAVAGLNALKNFLSSAYDIFYGGPDVMVKKDA